MNKILLIPSPNLLNQQIKPYIPYGLLSLRAIAQKFGEEVDILPTNGDLLKERFHNSEELARALLDQVNLQDYDIVGFSTLCNSFHHSLQIARAIKQHQPDMRIWMGGPHASFVSEQILEAFGEIEAVFVGEGEMTFAEVMARRVQGNPELKGIGGIRTREHGFIPREPIHDLDELPVVDLPQHYLQNLSELQQFTFRKSLPLEVTRGCPGRCSFCSTRLHWGKYVRRKSDMRVISEMQRLNERTGITSFDFIGDNFGSPSWKLFEFCETMSREAPEFHWRCDLKMDNLEQDDLGRLWKGGCRGLFVGVESSSQETLDRIHKGVCLVKELGIIEKALQMGFEVETSFIIGFPWETPEDVDLTFKLHCRMLKLGVIRSQVFLLCPLPGTELANQYHVHFDRWASHIAIDGIPLDDVTWDLVYEHQDIFSHLGYFDAPDLDRINLIATRDTACQLNYL